MARRQGCEDPAHFGGPGGLIGVEPVPAQLHHVSHNPVHSLLGYVSGTVSSSIGGTVNGISPRHRAHHRPAPGCAIEIVDDHDHPLPSGEPGRLRVSTPFGLGGYLYDQAATKAHFRDGFFYTGDLGVLGDDGRLMLRGRFTDVINIGGHKVSPAPIEERLRDALGVSDVCLLSAPDDHGEEQLHLMIETPAPIVAAALAAVLRQELSGFAGVHVQFTTALPRNGMGKVQRQAAILTLTADKQTM